MSSFPEEDNSGIYIERVDPGSIGEETGIEKGDMLLDINGKLPRDIIDYRWAAADEEIKLKILKKNGYLWEIDIEKDCSEELGLCFRPPHIKEVQRCSNNCIFCFIDQNPPGMRDSIYFKDDDYLLSFLEGHYITLTSTTDKELERIARERISPLYISIHTTNPSLRQKMMRSKNAGNILSRLEYLALSGIILHGQVVLCPGWNDGSELERTLRELAELGPQIQSVSVVPVGITRHRAGLNTLQPVDESTAARVLDTVHGYQEAMLARRGSRVFFAADEFYLKAGYSLPREEDYENYPQLSNGVGLLRLKWEEYKNWEPFAELDRFEAPLEITLVTGRAAEDIFREVAAKLEGAVENLAVNLEVVDSIFYGPLVNVAGLLTGLDLEYGLSGKKLGDAVIFPRVMLREMTESFLDNRTPADAAVPLRAPLFPAADLQEVEEIIFQEAKSKKQGIK